ncbi:MAG: hypothetical protein HKN20_01325 [Gemmatimonadetes bacterium]|nr:hypothetical protein [Gemmatimonadota bacterium]
MNTSWKATLGFDALAAPLLLMTLCLLLAPTPGAAFVIIDDFNVGTYWESAVDTTITIVPVGPSGAGHVISPTRRFHFRPNAINPGTLSAQLGVGGGTRMKHSSENGSGNIEVEWRWGFPVDLTEGGAVDTICFDVTTTPASGGALFVTFEDVNGLHGQARSMPTPGLYKYDLSIWIVDMTQLVAISIHSQFGNQGTAFFEINDIRTKGQGTVTPNFLGDWTLVETNPLPSSPCIFRTLDEIGNPVYRTEIGWNDIQVGGTIPALHGVWSDAPYGNGETCAITMNTDVDGGYIYEWYGYYEMFVDVADVPGRNAEIVYPPDPVHDTRSIALPIHVLTRDNVGTQNGDSRVMMSLTLGENQPAEMQNPMVTPVFSKNQSTLTGFILAFELITQDIILDSEPVFEIDWSGEWEEVTISTGVAGASDTEGAILPALANLAATPSITRDGTELRAARPFAPGDAIAIYDVRGRLVRELQADAGMSSLAWDGRETSGARAAAGVYFARKTNDPQADSARIVLVR